MGSFSVDLYFEIVTIVSVFHLLSLSFSKCCEIYPDYIHLWLAGLTIKTNQTGTEPRVKSGIALWVLSYLLAVY